MSTICWLTKRPGRFESQRFAPIVDILKRHGYSVIWLEAPTITPEFDVKTWLSEKLPTSTSAIFFGERDLESFKQIAKSVRVLSHTELKFVPLFWVYADVDIHCLDKLSEIGVDDYFHISFNPHDVLSRIRLRIKEAQIKARMEAELHAHSLKDAKTETTVKQREEFLSVCAHDLRSPLGIIQSSLSMVLDSNGGKPPIAPAHLELLTRAKRQSVHALTLVNDLLDVMSFEQGLKPKYKLLNLHELLLQFHEDYRQQADEKKVGFHYDNPIKEWRVLADADRVKQLMQNLFTNALKFTEKDKNIFLNVMAFDGRRKEDPPHPMIVITVRDEGVGIPANEFQKIFDRFTQIKDYSKPEGRGLGLTVAKQISTLHDGNIWVESAEGKGSTFFVLFPHVISRTQVTPKVHSPNKKNTILIADPSLDRREKYYRGLEGWGYEVAFVKDGVEALTMLYHTLPAAMILTPELAKFDEAEVIEVAKNDIITSSIPILVALEESQRLEGRHASLQSHAIKLPLSKESFHDKIKQMLAVPEPKAA